MTADGAPTFYRNVIFSWQVPNSENGVAGYSYALNQSPAYTTNRVTTSVTVTNISFGTNIFQVMAKGSNGVWGTASSFRLIVQPVPDLTQGTVITIAGSPICRSLIYDRLAALYDPGYMVISNSPMIVTYYGTMTNNVPGIGPLVHMDGSVSPTPVAVCCSFTNSSSGINDMNVPWGEMYGGQIPTASAPWSYDYRYADLVASVIDPASAYPPVYYGDYQSDYFGVVPYVFVHNSALIGADNITCDQARLLMTSSGAITGQPFHGMTAQFLGGLTNAPVYLIPAVEGRVRENACSLKKWPQK